ncbi:16S rRNA (adenine(1518)-N(6)/adenine(1519)-N(6))-dimethyltransferase RsmA [Peptoniphilus sp. KCTC 25270]|uniref:16S rRNA (adenine(1518)-N(6)/adenine(1519)-N(6))- dimethyltransferase RsmA n=1 Tax=Peptoniphilus sp. KCTC 25270 TaxID=2897414 RepID=UPI001E371109|nr:16S rRNA (adenine(1518)-N(6)/adenine(1519)-N(6))-dimethyltransferase RsmA [Peptoniphilus sp. KCTC 25270]MCD1146753.1 16S rRNA (adenine(1518)-N(6)/adenine(1519)-N(6))-dimethyltransferase RsmA [Peptoniphilus sp. KCTC 25270]
MDDLRLYSPQKIRQVVQDAGFSFSKSLGQNFLIDGNILRKISQSADLKEGDLVLEIGTGIGTLTEELALSGADVFCVEIDRSLEPILQETLARFENVEILFQDIMKTNLAEEIHSRYGRRPIKVVANLPYYVTTPILMKLFREDLELESIHVMVQKEMGERISAPVGTKSYGSLSVYMQLRSKIERVVNVPRTCFMPQPRVDSIVIAFREIRSNPSIDYDQLERITRAAFSKRRKTVLNALSSYGLSASKEEIAEALEKTGIPLTKRAEQITLDEYIVLGQNFPKLIGAEENEGREK